jgi:hypothetical protein
MHVWCLFEAGGPDETNALLAIHLTKDGALGGALAQANGLDLTWEEHDWGVVGFLRGRRVFEVEQWVVR